MSIAEKLTAIAENEPLVYEAGKQAEYTRMKEAYKEKGVLLGGIPPKDYGEFIEDTFAQTLVKRKLASDFIYLFYRNNITKTYSIDLFGSGSYANFYGKCSNLEKAGYINLPNATSVAQGFIECSKLESISAILAPKATSISQLFQNCTSLKRVEIMDINAVSSSTGANNAFYNCGALEYIRFQGLIKTNISFQWSPLLDRDSLMSIINALQYTNSKEDTYELSEELSSIQLPNFPVAPHSVTIYGVGERPWENFGRFDIGRVADNGNGELLALDYNSGAVVGNIDYATGLITFAENYSANESVTYSYFLPNANQNSPLLTLGATNLAKLTDEEKAIIEDKGWQYQ